MAGQSYSSPQSSSMQSSEDLVCEAPESSSPAYTQASGNSAAQDDVCIDESGQQTQSLATEGTGGQAGATPPPAADNAQWWKSAPQLEIPWPPFGENQRKHAVGWSDGPNYSLSFPQAKWPSNGKETLFKAPPVQVQTPVPGVVLDLFAKAEWGLSAGGQVGMSLEKKGTNSYKATASGTVNGKASIGVTGGVGLGVGGGGVSVGVSGNLGASLEAGLQGTIQVSAECVNGVWSTTISSPLSFKLAVTVQPSAALYVKVWDYNTELATLTLGTWTIATAGVDWTPTARIAGGAIKNETKAPTIIGPQWGAPPEAKEA